MWHVSTSKGEQRICSPVRKYGEAVGPLSGHSMDVTGPYPVTQRRNKFLLTFIDGFSKYVEAFPMVDQTAESCTRIYASQIVTRHGSGSTLIDQGRSFVSAFFKETCRILGIRKVNTTSFHPASNGMVERFHRSLHSGLSHYIDSANTNWDVVVPFYLMAYRATPNTTTGFSPFYPLHGREMSTKQWKPKAKTSSRQRKHCCRLQTRKPEV